MILKKLIKNNLEVKDPIEIIDKKLRWSIDLKIPTNRMTVNKMSIIRKNIGSKNQNKNTWLKVLKPTLRKKAMMIFKKKKITQIGSKNQLGITKTRIEITSKTKETFNKEIINKPNLKVILERMRIKKKKGYLNLGIKNIFMEIGSKEGKEFSLQRILKCQRCPRRFYSYQMRLHIINLKLN